MLEPNDVAAMIGALTQLRFLAHELGILVGSNHWRMLTLWFSPAAWALVRYRVDRAGYLACGRPWAAVRLLLLPFFVVVRALGPRCDIHYRACIGRGLRILHPDLGIVVSGRAVIGDNLLLTGGNCIGMRTGQPAREIHIGSNVSLGANAVILGPLTLGDNLVVGAGAVVVESAPAGSTMVGVPARRLPQAQPVP